MDLTADQAAAVAAMLVALGVRPIRAGSLTLHWDKSGALRGCEERRHREFSGPRLAAQIRNGHTERTQE